MIIVNIEGYVDHFHGYRVTRFRLSPPRCLPPVPGDALPALWCLDLDPAGSRWLTSRANPHFSWAGHFGVCFSLWQRPLRISGRSSGGTLCFRDQKAMPTRWVNSGHADPRSHRTGQWFDIR